MKEKFVDRKCLVNYIEQEISQNRFNFDSLLILLKCDAFTPISDKKLNFSDIKDQCDYITISNTDDKEILDFIIENTFSNVIKDLAIDRKIEILRKGLK